jgi:Flp pilus assembly protein TadG
MWALSRIAEIRRRASDFVREQGGVSAVEFAILLPVMLSLYFGGVELSQAVGADRKVTLVARTVSDLSSRLQTIQSSDMTNIMNAAVAVIAPYVHSNLSVTVTGVNIDNKGNATVAWSCTFQGTARAKNSAVTVPSQLITPNTASFLVWGEAQFDYTPTIGYVLTGTMHLKDQIYMAPRLGASVNGPPSC